VSRKNILNIFDCNLKKVYQILVIFDTNISDTTGDQTTVQFFTTRIVCFCTTWGNTSNLSKAHIARDSSSSATLAIRAQDAIK